MSSKSQKQKKRNKIIALFIVLTLVVSSMTALLSVIASMLQKFRTISIWIQSFYILKNIFDFDKVLLYFSRGQVKMNFLQYYGYSKRT